MILAQTSADVMISCAHRLHSYLVSQQATELSLLTPQVWTAPALTETKEVTDGVGHSVALGYGVAAGRGVFVGSRAEVGKGAFVGRGVAVGIGPGVAVEVVRAAATFASTVASIAVSASRVLLTPASTVAGTSAVGRDAACSSAVDGASLEQATAVRPETTRRIRMIILIFLPQCRDNFQSSLSTGSAAPGADRSELPGRRPGQDAPVSSSTSSPFRLRRRVRTRGLPAEHQRLRAMPQPWILACVAEVPEVIANSVFIQVHVPVLVYARVACGRVQLASTASIGDASKSPAPHSRGPWRGPGLTRRFIPGSPRRSGHA